MDIRGVSGLLANRPTTVTAPAPDPAARAVADGAAQTPEASASKTSPASASSPSDPVVVAGGYISPVLRYDQDARLAVIYYRDRSSGETQNQIPAERVVEEYRRTASRLGNPTDRTAEGDGTVSARRGADKGSASSAGTTTPGGAGQSNSFLATVGSALSSNIPAMGGAGTGAPATGAGLPGAASGAGAYGTGSPGALVSVTV